MKNQNILGLIVLSGLLLSACKSTDNNFDATGSFEAIERTISAQATGKILDLEIHEGQELKAGDTIGHVDVSALQLQAEQIEASIGAIGKKTNDAGPQVFILEAQKRVQEDQIATVEQQIEILDKEIGRFQNLVEAKAAPQKQLDDLTGQKSILVKKLKGAEMQIQVLNAQVEAAKKNVSVMNRGITSEIEPTLKRLEMIQKQIDDATIVNDFNGTVTTQFVYDGEFVSMGRPLYKIADLSEMTLKAYISGNQLAQIKLNDQVTVLTDDGSGGYKETTGTVSWISSKAEFTPKTIQTKDERANKVYAIKILVKNDGSYKMGMYAEVNFK
ncbi:HlyD family secretion protein [Portibacter lacus]|uniref:Membrane protein n=1 Tax=Portibacter lacus TaxID=1099794 RepID=A0AA37WC39_9BACT|nr:efflux RND transporter periplasmic adaptor subunit [Portibacter lacus]GLR15748.1 membrane protein [Portibacter lacus]